MDAVGIIRRSEQNTRERKRERRTSFSNSLSSRVMVPSKSVKKIIFGLLSRVSGKGMALWKVVLSKPPFYKEKKEKKSSNRIEIEMRKTMALLAEERTQLNECTRRGGVKGKEG